LRLDLASADAGEIPIASPTPLQHSDTYALRRREVAPHPIHLLCLVCVQFEPFQDGSAAYSLAVSEALCVCLFRPFHGAPRSASTENQEHAPLAATPPSSEAPRTASQPPRPPPHPADLIVPTGSRATAAASSPKQTASSSPGSAGSLPLGGGYRVLQRQALRPPEPDNPAHVGHPYKSFLLQLLRGQGGVAAGVAEDNRGPDQRNKTFS